MKDFTYHEFNGLVFIGDPHIWSRNPGSRIDEDFSNTVLNKLDEAFTFCLNNNFYPIILGDLFHKKEEHDISMLTKLTRVLKKRIIPSVSVEGNHEKSQTKLSDDVALNLLKEAETLFVIEESDVWGMFNVNGKKVILGSTPHGSVIPLKVDISIKNTCDYLFWLTHHDLDFGETYPGAVPINEIENVDYLVNGHIHKTKPIMQIGKMKAFNPGNIVRLSTDCANHVPNIWIWKPESCNEFIPHTLKYKKECFKVEKTDILGISTSDTIEELDAKHISNFVNKMEQEFNQQESAKTDDGTLILKSINTYAKSLNVTDEFTKEVIAFAETVISNNP